MSPTAVFLLVSFVFSGSVGLALFVGERVVGDVPALARMALLMVYMAGPALGAVVAQRVAKEPVAALGFRFRMSWWWVAAWLLPFFLCVLAGVASAFVPGVEASLEMTGVLERLKDLPPEQQAEARAKLASFPPLLLGLLQAMSALFAGLSVNAAVAFGEELGWRGFLHERLQRVERWRLARCFWRRAAVVGFMWGLWHAPIILQGHNYPDHPVTGVFMMVAFCVLLSPWFAHIRDVTGSVIAASIMHGTLNGAGGLAILFLAGGSDLTIGMTGLAGLLVLVAANVALFFIRSRGDGAQSLPAS